MKLDSMNCLSRSSERVSADFAVFFSQFHNKRGNTKQNTQLLSLLQLIKTKAVQTELRTNHEAVDCVLPY